MKIAKIFFALSFMVASTGIADARPKCPRLPVKKIVETDDSYLPSSRAEEAHELPLNPVFYKIQCVPAAHGVYSIFRNPRFEPRLMVRLDLRTSSSMDAYYFATVDGLQYIYGNIVDASAHITAQRVYVRSDSWKCQIYDLRESISDLLEKIERPSINHKILKNNGRWR